jgi:hypothetical protein
MVDCFITVAKSNVLEKFGQCLQTRPWYAYVITLIFRRCAALMDSIKPENLQLTLEFLNP